MEYSNELYHHGIKGMKWGVRRYQNKDGSLTPAGQKRRAKLESKLEKLTGSKKDTDVAMTNRKKSLSEMTDDEVRAYTNRMTLEKNYRDAERNLAAVTPQKISKGQKFVNTVMNDMIQPALANSGRKALESMMDQAVKKATKGQTDGDSIEALTKVRDKLKLKAEINKYKNSPDGETNWDNMLKKQQWEENERKRAETKAKEDAAKKAEKEAADTAKKAEKEAAKEAKKAEKEAAKEAKKAEKEARRERDNNTSDNGYDDINWNDYKREKPPIVDVYEDDLIRDVPVTTRRAGENYVTYLLEERNK